LVFRALPSWRLLVWLGLHHAHSTKHHVKEEEGEMFPKLRKSDMDLMEVGAQLAGRKKELMAQMKAAA
jgi:hypothetical protein